MANDDRTIRCADCGNVLIALPCPHCRSTRSPLTREELDTALGVLAAVAECIKSLTEVPSGVLFAQLTAIIPGYTLTTHESIIAMLIRSGLVRRKPYAHHVLVWMGGKRDGTK